ncbi:MAG TPA: flagellar biosynthetic protein FliR [Kofleriaceae bacterium]|nr:flagellar biosynthetic protein FliR [Kofleriaceae bacterium]
MADDRGGGDEQWLTVRGWASGAVADDLPAALVLALRGAAAVGVLTTLVGGLPAVVRVGLAVTAGLWAALLAGAAVPGEAWWLVAMREAVIGATIGVIAAIPLLAAVLAGRLIDGVRGAGRGPYGALFGVLAAAVFVGIDGHVMFVTAIVDSFRAAPAVASVEPRVLASLAALIPIAVRLAIPWLITAAVVEIAAGVALRLAGRAAGQLPGAPAAPAALVMITASLVGTLAVAIATLVRGAG